MYSRFPRQDRPVQIPEHYSGCAFSPPKPSPYAERKATPALEIPVSPLPPSSIEKPLHPEPCDECKPEEKAVDYGIADALRHTFSGSLPSFLSGMNFEEFLLIGLILLLARSDQDNDMILWLALLLLGK